MLKCKTCSAPLPSNSNRCSYCGTRNPIDLHGVHQFTINKPDEARMCPHCFVPMDILNVDIDGKFYIERCPECFGFFFDPGEIETLLDHSVSNITIDPKTIDKANRELTDFNSEIQYIRCPVCNEFMQRINYGYRSGVVIDRCMKHGIWLDSGELRHLMEWKKSGGKILDEKFKKEQKEDAEKRQREKDLEFDYSPHYRPSSGGGLIQLILRLFGWM